MTVNATMSVAGTSDVHNLAESIRMGFVDGADVVELVAIGAQAVNQAVKAVAIARRRHGMSVVVAPSFIEVEKEGTLMTAMKLEVCAA